MSLRDFFKMPAEGEAVTGEGWNFSQGSALFLRELVGVVKFESVTGAWLSMLTLGDMRGVAAAVLGPVKESSRFAGAALAFLDICKSMAR